MNRYGCVTLKLYLQKQKLALSLLIPSLYSESRLGYSDPCICQTHPIGHVRFMHFTIHQFYAKEKEP